MSGTLIPIVAIVSIFVVPVAAIAWILVSLINSRNKERMRMINNGIEPREYKKPAPNKYTTLRNACLFMGLAIGMFLGIYLGFYSGFDDHIALLIMTATIVLFIGLGYLAFYLLVRNKNMDEE